MEKLETRRRPETKIMKYRKKNQRIKEKFVLKVQHVKDINKCANAACRLRKAGCRGFEGCPGYMARELE